MKRKTLLFDTGLQKLCSRTKEDFLTIVSKRRISHEKLEARIIPQGLILLWAIT